MFPEKGQTLTEVIVVSTIGILVVTALTFATMFSLRNASSAKAASQAAKLAQEGIERVRMGRDRNNCIMGLDGNNYSWNGSSTFANCSSSPSIWTYQITSSSGCDNISTGNKCYFIVLAGQTNPVLAGRLRALGSYSPLDPLPSGVEEITLGNLVFKRVVELSDDADFDKQKTVTVIVRWTDFSGDHDSKLSTILGKL